MAQGHLGSPTVAIHTVAIPQPNDSPSRTTTKDVLRRRMGRSKTPPPLRVPVTPPRLCQTTEDDNICPRPARERVNSRDYIHSYDGAYGAGNDDMIGLDVARSAGGWWEQHQLYMFSAYIVVLWLVALVVTMAVSPAGGALANKSLTVTNVIHFAVTLINLHWTKGSCREGQGDLEHMTLWEQIEATPHTGWLRFGLRVVPVLICWSACTQAGWETKECSFNAVVLYLTLLGKLPFMNGVRLLGINAHPVIDKEK